MPYRDFWEHHTPLTWYLFAPFSRLTDAPGAEAIIAMRWLQVPLWVATFWLMNLWMRGAGLSSGARWKAMTLALCSSLFMLPAVEYRVEALGCLLVAGALLLAQRNRDFAAGVLFCLAGFANLRLVPILAAAVLLHLPWSGGRFGRREADGEDLGGRSGREADGENLGGRSGREADGEDLGGRSGRRSTWLVGGGAAALGGALFVFAPTGALDELWQQVWNDNRAERFAAPVVGGFIHRLLVPFGVRILATDREFELAAVDVGGMAVLLLGFAGVVLAWRRREVRTIAILQLVNLAFIASMKFIYNYHFALAVILFLPLMAAAIERIPRRAFVTALLVLAWSVNAFASIFRGKEHDLRYQDLVMQEAHARTRPGERVWSGVPWALRREPAYRFWFLPELARQLVLQRLAPRYSMHDPPALVVFDHYALVWVATVQRELAPYLVRHYVPVWRNLWVPGMNAVVRPGETVEWIVPRDGTYRLIASPRLARHRWFRDPFNAYRGEPLTLQPMPDPPLSVSAGPALRKGQRVAVTSHASEPLGVILLSGNDRVLFQQPPGGASLEAETTRVTHVPDL